MQKITLSSHPKYTQIEENIGKIEIDGCYPGYGTTLGNTLRRVLLSSLPGTAATSVKVKGISHEYSTIPGVLEDAIQMILNLKKIRFHSHKDEPVKLTLKEKGLKKITAGDIQCPSDVEVINKDALIATITDKKGEVEMEIEVQNGLGYVPVEQQIRETKEIGLIAIDAVFTPVRRVNYSVENTRVGKRTDFDKITLEIETDGSIDPKEAYEKAVKLIVEQFENIKDFEIEQKEEVQPEVGTDKEDKKKADEATEEKREVAKEESLNTGIEALSLSTRTMNVLEKGRLKTVSDLIALSEEQMMELEGMGGKGIKEIKKAIGNFGLTLKAQ
ncbi:MAG: DNA-directed RNA polymerase subunit alpha [Parcubacteria group bacterium]|jgi:DNA-directed RNA polymerase subunit alpha